DIFRIENQVEGHLVVVVGGVGSSHGTDVVGARVLVHAHAHFVLSSETMLVEGLGGGFKYGLEVKHDYELLILGGLGEASSGRPSLVRTGLLQSIIFRSLPFVVAALAAQRHGRMPLVTGVLTHLVAAPTHVGVDFLAAPSAHFSFGTGGAHDRPSDLAR